MDREIVITGGAGFIGSNLANMYLSRGDNVTVVDNFSTSKEDFSNPEIKIIRCDLSISSEMDKIDKVICDADIIYHMASSVGVKYIDKQPQKAIRNSFVINNNIFPIFEKYKSRVIFGSTSEVYGNTTTAKETDVLKIGSPDTLRWGYACGKLMSEFLLKSYNFPSTIVRFFNISGSGQLSDHGMVIPTFINKAKMNDDIIVYGDGMQNRAFCDVRDAVQMLDVVSSEMHVGEIYNIGNDANNITIQELAMNVINNTNSKSKIIHREYSEDYSSNFGEIFQRKPNIDKIKRHYKPKYNIDDIIKSML